MLSKQDRINIFMSLFRGRSDVFARRWEKYDGSISGYSPAYVDWKKKTYAPLVELVIEKHLLGSFTVGVYPLLGDNTSYFIAADFDGENWLRSIKRLWETAKMHNISTYIERSRSGKGGHLWCFFREAYPAYKSRKIFFHLLRQSRNIDDFDKDESFDRLFPNQDYLSGRGLGNLIALPLQAVPRRQGNSVFLDPANNFEFAVDQWQFLHEVERVSTERLDDLFGELSGEEKLQKGTGRRSDGIISLTLAEYIAIPKATIPRKLANFLREELNFLNTDYVVKQRIGVSTYNLEKYFRTIVTSDANVLVPRGFLAKVIAFLKEEGIAFELEDQRNKTDNISIRPTFNLFPYQKEALQVLQTTELGVLVAPPGSGKTIIGLALIAEKGQPAIVLTHRKQIYDQWLERIEYFLGIPKHDIGQFTSTKKEIKSPITVAMVQSLSKLSNWDSVRNAFGFLLIDECHHMPARLFRDVVTKFNTYYLYGLTSTPKRKNNDEKLIYAYLGDIVHEIPRDYQILQRNKSIPKSEIVISRQIEIIVRETHLSLPFEAKQSDYQTLLKILTCDAKRNEQIAQDIAAEAHQHNKCLVLTERKEHVEMLTFYLKRDFEIVTLTGDLTPKKRKQQEQNIQDGNFQILIATGQLLGEGTDITNLDCLFLVFPFTFEGKLIQYIGRIQRGEGKAKRVYDYRDREIVLLDRMFKKRQRYYNKFAK